MDRARSLEPSIRANLQTKMVLLAGRRQVGKTTSVDSALVFFKQRLTIPWAYQVTLGDGRDFLQDGVRVVPASRFLDALA